MLDVTQGSAAGYDVDLYCDEVLDDPYPHYRALRDLGAAVWLPRNRLWAIGRHADVRDALFNHAVYSSAQGVAANERTNAIARGNLLASDPPEHDRLRRVVGAPLTPKAVSTLLPSLPRTCRSRSSRSWSGCRSRDGRTC
jgi:cytochrome P450